jgi:hypothetical protein
LASQSKRVSKAEKKATGLALAPIFLILQQVLAAHALDSPYGVMLAAHALARLVRLKNELLFCAVVMWL